MASRKVTRSITAPMVYLKNNPKGIHMPGCSLRAAEQLVKDMGVGNVIKTVMETLIYELDEEVFIQNAHIKEPKANKEND